MRAPETIDVQVSVCMQIGGMTTSPTITKIATAFLAAQREFVNPKKGPMTKMGSYSHAFASLEDSLAAVLPALNSHGILVMQPPHGGEGGSVAVDTTFIHTESGEWMCSTLGMKCGALPQAVASAISYCRRYSIQGSTATVGETDDDGQAAQRGAEQPAPPPAPKLDPFKENARKLVDEYKERHPEMTSVRIVEASGITMTPADKGYWKALLSWLSMAMSSQLEPCEGCSSCDGTHADGCPNGWEGEGES